MIQRRTKAFRVTFLLVCFFAVMVFVAVKPTHAANYDCTAANETWLDACLAQGGSGDTVNITVTADYDITAQKTISAGKTINLTSDATPRTLTRNAAMTGATDRLFEVSGTLNLANITLDGDWPTVEALSPLVYVLAGGALNINSGATLQNNSNNSATSEGSPTPSGGAVYIDAGGSGSINSGGLVSSNRARLGAGVMTKGDFAINGGEIADNYAPRSGGGTGLGGGVYLTGSSAEVVMSGGKVTHNTAHTGGGIYHSATTGTLSITGATISGNQAGLDGGGVFSAGDLTLTGSTIQNNKALRTDGTVTPNYGDREGGGGGVAHVKGSLTINGSQFLNNESSYSGGGLYVATKKDAVAGVLIENSLFRGNRSLNAGAGMRVDAAATLTNVVIEDNSSNYYGGGFVTSDGNINPDPADRQPLMNFDRVTIRNNSATNGGAGLYAEDAAMVIRNSEITGNRAANSAGAVFAQSAVDFADSSVTNNQATTTHTGGVRFATGTIVSNFDNVTITGNSATTYGGGVVVNALTTPVPITRSLISGNSAGTLGGGIYNTASATVTTVVSDSEILNNTASTDGGGIYAENYNSLTVAADVKFAGNLAQYGTVFDLPADTVNWPTYQANIAVPDGAWSYGLRYGYNNFDINYASGDQVFAVRFDTAGGSSVPTELVAADGLSTAAEPAAPTRSGYRFVGWFADAGLTLPYDFSGLVTGNLVLYAKWAAEPGAPNTGAQLQGSSAETVSLTMILVCAVAVSYALHRRIKRRT